MSFKIIDIPNDGAYESDYLTVFTEVLEDLVGTDVNYQLLVAGQTYTLTYTVDATSMSFTSTADSVEDFLKRTLKSLVQTKIETDLV